MSVSFRRHDNIGYIEFDMPDSKVNLLTSKAIFRLKDILDDIGRSASLKAIIISSKKKNVFIAGADIKEIEDIREAKVGEAKSKAGQEVLDKLEDLKVPTVAVIDGVALGGGCELALACRYRISTFNDKVRIGLPEVNLGIIPGFGGTYRMPRLVGLSEALKLITSGRPVTSEKAIRIGLVDRVYTQIGLEEHVAKFVDEIQDPEKAKSIKAKRKKKKGFQALLDDFFVGQIMVFDAAKAQILKATKGFYPAPVKALEVVKNTITEKRDKALQMEAQGFSELVTTDTCKNLIHFFYIMERYKKLMPPESDGIIPKEIGQCSVIGAGVMGGGIAQLLSSREIWTRMKDINYDALTLGFEAANKVYQQAVKRRKFKPYDAQRKMAKISGALDYSGMKKVDLVIEAVVENMDVKKKVFQELSEQANPGTILCTNTSALSVGEMAEMTKEPQNVIGLHFFNPVHRMPLVEIITTDKTSKETVVSTINLARKLGKTVILVKDSAGFLVNRVLLSYLNEAGRILEEGGKIEQIDRIMTDFGMPMGPFTLIDEVGIDVGIKVLQILENAFGERFKPVEIYNKVYKNGFLGKKSGKGFYIHDKKRIPNQEVTELVDRQHSLDPNEQEWCHRMILIMVNEAARCLEDGVVDEPAAVDLGMVMGTGFPAFRGGLLRYADSFGMNNLMEVLNLLQGKYNADRFKPCQYLVDLKNSDKSFFN